MARPEKVGVSERQFRGNRTVRQQLLRSVDIRQQRVEEPRPLRDAEFDLAPFGSGQQDRQRIEHPGAIASLWIGVDIVGYAVFHDQTARQFDAAAHGIGAFARQGVDQRTPVRAHVPRTVEQLVVAVRIAQIGFKARVDHHSDANRA